MEFLSSRHGFNTLTPYTTRQPRTSESEGVHYHFRSEKELRELSANFAKGYWIQPLDSNWYGYSEHLDELADHHGNWVLQMHSEIALKVKKRHPRAITVFLDYQSDSVFQKRLAERYNGDKSEMSNRRKHGERERRNKAAFDHYITSDNPEHIADQVARIALSQVIQSPPHEASQPGPLSDSEIIESLNSKTGIVLEGVTPELWPERIKGWSIDFTLSPKYFRVQRPSLIRRVFDLAHASEKDLANMFREQFAHETDGIYLRPNEFILASTNEKICLPKDVVGLISGRSSYARLGISIELSQVILQPGHNDTLPLQIKNNLPYPVILYPNTAIAQAVLFRSSTHAKQDYQNQKHAKYLGRLADIRSRFYDDPIYARIRQQRPAQRQFDWEYSAKLLSFLSGMAAALSWAVSEMTKQPATSIAAKQVAVVSFVLTVTAACLGYIVLRRR